MYIKCTLKGKNSMQQTDFSTLSLQPSLLKNLASLGYENMTPIQAGSIPFVLSGRDIIAQGKTGSGKTAAFGLGILNKLDLKLFCVQSLILCPTRELADQVAKELRRLGRSIPNIKIITLCGGTPLYPQTKSLEHGSHIIVGTPGRIDDHLKKGSLKLDKLTTLVLDEADRMLEMGFQVTLDAIFQQIPAKRQTLLFSATFPDEIEVIAKRILVKPERVQTDLTHNNETIKQHLFEVDETMDRITALRLLLLKYQPISTVIFCNTKKATTQVAGALSSHGFQTLALNGDLEQRDRDQTLVRFANKSVSVLVATDVAARGLDIDDLNAVINYEIANDVEVHLHRIGRTGRAGSSGIACTLFHNKEQYKITRLEDYLKQSIEAEPLPSFDLLENIVPQPLMTTLKIESGKKQKIRPGDIVGALTAGNKITNKEIGKIHIFDQCSYVAVRQKITQLALQTLKTGKLKGRTLKVRIIANEYKQAKKKFNWSQVSKNS
jgi:ATP-dependent RNA helicase DbpA